MCNNFVHLHLPSGAFDAVNTPTIIGLSLVVIGVTIIHLMNDIDVK